MKLSYAITVCNEHRELDNLLYFLTENKDAEDEINVLLDAGKATDKVRSVLKKYEGIEINEKEFDGNFADHRNYHASVCSGDYIFVIDADEMPQIGLIENVKNVLSETDADIMGVPRINICPGYTQKWLDKHNFKVNECGWINWPDFQGRIYRNVPSIKWEKGLHERLVGSEKVLMFQPNPYLALWHIKSIQRQDKQDEFYGNMVKK